MGAIRLLLIASIGVTSGCVFLDVKEQQEKMRAACTIKGTARSMQDGDRAVVVVLLHRGDTKAEAAGNWHAVSHFVLEHAGKFVFSVNGATGTYTVGAFDDANRNLMLDPGESFISDKDSVTCTPGARFDDFVLNIPEKPQQHATDFDVAGVQSRTLNEQVSAIFGQTVAIGELTSLAEDMFSQEVAESGLWRPFDFLVDGYAGVWFLEAYDPKRIPVLFVHGVNGTPKSFDYLIRNLDHTRFQAWVYYYPSGLHLGTVADQLSQTMTKLQIRYRVPRFAVVAHSMGGLVARGFVLRHAESSPNTQIPLFLSVSTPWGGHKAAGAAIDNKFPMVVEVWRDMAPGSAYQKDVLSRPLPAGMQHHMVFTYQRNSSSFGESDDQGVTVSSQLALPAQSKAVRLYGLDETHVGVLRDPLLSKMLNELLTSSF
jgi:pimeloyl-ACP methyl ester carboxylesterase